MANDRAHEATARTNSTKRGNESVSNARPKKFRLVGTADSKKRIRLGPGKSTASEGGTKTIMEDCSMESSAQAEATEPTVAGLGVTTADLQIDTNAGLALQPTTPVQPVRSLVVPKSPSPKLANQFASFDAERTKEAYTHLSNEIRARSASFVCELNTAVGSWDEMTPYLSEMQALLSQRGKKRQAVLREAGLPTWTEWFENFKKGLGLRISLRAVQNKLAKLRDRNAAGTGGKTKSPTKHAKPESKTAPYKHGYQAAKGEMADELKAAAERNVELGKRVAELESENQKLHEIDQELQEQLKKSRDKAATKLPPQVEKLKE
jgi:hypothetical protein